MSEEEKKAIEMLNKYIAEHKFFNIRQADNLEGNIEISINLIEKQQKEIEKYKKVIDNRDFTWKQKYEETFEYVNKEFISKDKIREKIKEYDDFYKEYPIEFRKYKMRPITVVLKELLEEE